VNVDGVVNVGDKGKVEENGVSWTCFWPLLN